MFPNLLTQERRNIMKYLRSLILALAILAMSVTPALADRPPFVFPSGCCYYNGTIVRTVVPPAATPNDGRDNFYAVMGGVADQKGVVAVAPGAKGYHGGDWAFYSVTWNVAPYLLTSEAAVLAAAASGDVTITRIPANDFKCPIQP
jgi:hypothetical protein